MGIGPVPATRKVLELAWADLLPKFGQPRCVVDGARREARFAVVAYGVTAWLAFVVASGTWMFIRRLDEPSAWLVAHDPVIAEMFTRGAHCSWASSRSISRSNR